MKPFVFPVITKVIINHFSLYSKQNLIEIDMDKSVFCLAGANGLGKSTFITILNYALTGIVRNPKRSFSTDNSIPAFYSRNKAFANKYFEGRIDEKSRDVADVEVHFRIGEYEYVIKRGFFDVEELRYFSRTKIGEVTNKIKDDELKLGDELCQSYMSSLTEDAGLSEFSQYAFLQHYVLTFDETHQLLFWDKEMMERVLYLFFGVDAKTAHLADGLRKKYKKLTSDSSNLQWDITQATRELEKLVSMASGSSKSDEIPKEVIEQYQLYTEQLNESITQLESYNHDIKQVQLEIADYSLNLNTLKREYEELFQKTLQSDSSTIESDPKIIEILKVLQYAINESGKIQEILNSLVSYIEENHAPKKMNNKKGLDEVFKGLEQLDQKIIELSEKLNNSNQRETRVLKEQTELEKHISTIKAELLKIEDENDNFLNSLYNERGDDITDLVSRFKVQIENLKEKKEQSLEHKRATKAELKKLEKNLKGFYQNAEERFIPLFNEYAESFIGLELNIWLQSYDKGMTLDLEVNDTRRKEAHQLSESQRYFLDIALRMALIEHASSKCSLMIDTPEGSLDIAYENKAGKMFADFSAKGYQLLMTANINSSELLKEIAKNCKNDGMILERMIYWTTLSQVQIELESKIEGAYNEIEEILNS
ncbi:AAA family ATPase [Winogradskyella flava]|uniref:AAA family ATPase n=1 Tax=Winogradskyella flava TaxID=1884876 RepID=A0A842IUN4_9FLAO|nr:AAA family ATPase [Winogradskyella flava]MBC2845067.1 AAA family ATPase [Winogradskyella flava]